MAAQEHNSDAQCCCSPARPVVSCLARNVLDGSSSAVPSLPLPSILELRFCIRRLMRDFFWVSSLGGFSTACPTWAPSLGTCSSGFEVGSPCTSPCTLHLASSCQRRSMIFQCQKIGAARPSHAAGRSHCSLLYNSEPPSASFRD